FKGATAQPERVSSSKKFDASFRQGGVESVTQAGNFYYFDDAHKAWADRAHYTPSDQMLLLEGSPRVADADTSTTAEVVRMNRATGEAYADGNVKSTYSNMKPQPGGALLASSDPIHVTSASMVAHSKAGTATYSGKARLWQGANVVEAPFIEFNRDQRSVVALGSKEKSVRSFLVQTDKEGKTTPVTVIGPKLTYRDNSRDAHFEGGVKAKGSDATVDADEMHVLLNQRELAADGKLPAEPAKVEQIIALGHVVVIQPGRNALGDKLVYTAATDKFVLTGGPPSIFDAEQGKITGVSLTLFRHDARVLVEGSTKSPTVTKTQVAR
ncbi:MAG: hypothetical protein JOY93_09655, partial [Acidobacteriales bacterium]|nr:hypothetical protein [Terriglobales bacterium]